MLLGDDRRVQGTAETRVIGRRPCVRGTSKVSVMIKVGDSYKSSER